MDKFEYKIFEFKIPGTQESTVENWANERGREGWHLFKLEWVFLEWKYSTEFSVEKIVRISAIGCRRLEGKHE